MVVLTHLFTTSFYKTNIVQSLTRNDFDEFFEAVKAYASLNFPPDEIKYPDDPYKESKKFKGNAFEVFGEFFLKYFSTHTDVGVVDYSPNFGKDLGVDGHGLSLDYQPLTVQFKFRSDPYSQLCLKDLATYLASSSFQFKIDPGSQRNLLILATTSGLNHNVEEVVPDCRFIGYSGFKKLTDGNIHFWDSLKQSLQESAKKPKARTIKTLYDHQKNARTVTIDDLLTSTSLDRAQVIMATGGGKTTNEHLAVEDSITHCKTRLHIVAAPRIALVFQLFNEFWTYKINDWHPILVNSSGEDQELDAYTGEELLVVEPTTMDDKIDQQIDEAFERNQPVVIFITYHSLRERHLERLTRKYTVDLAICDEAHNLTRKDWFPLLSAPVKKWIFYTATRKINYSKNNSNTSNIGQGMNNVQMFGYPIVSLSPRYLMDLGMIVPPRLHLVHVPAEDVRNFKLHGSDKKDYREQMAAIVAGVREHVEQVKNYGDDSARIIIFCKNATDAHDFADSATLRTELPDFTIDAVTSYKEKMKRKREEIFESFKKEKYSIIFHYDVLSEGIDLPGATGILVLRALKEIKATQGVGRTLRALAEDRFNLSIGKIEVGDSSGWQKPYGWIILPIIEGKNEDAMERIKQIACELRSRDYNIDVEKIKVSGRAVGKKRKKGDLKPALTQKEKESLILKILGKDIQEIIDEVDHEIEAEEVLLMNTTVKEIDYGI